MLSRERQIQYLMRRFGLTREEAEGLLNFEASQSQKAPQPKPSVIVEERKGDKDPENAVFWGVVALLAGFAGLALADWLLKQLSRKKRRKGEVEEWLV